MARAAERGTCSLTNQIHVYPVNAALLVEDEVKCPYCKKPLFWISHRESEGSGTEEFRFGCETCKRAYLFAGGRLSEQRKERGTRAESEAMARSECESVMSHRCPECGGPISNERAGSMFSCLWCGEKYAVELGELVQKPEDFLISRSKTKVSEFYAVQRKR